MLENIQILRITYWLANSSLIIDAWKYSDSQDVPLEFVQELFLSIIKNQNIQNKKKVFTEFCKKLLPDSLSLKIGISPLFLNFNYDLKKDQKKEIKSIDKNEKISKNSIPTIIFVDNIERLGNHSWDLLKTLLKFQKFENFLIILITNIDQLKKNTSTSQSEYPIEKYINFNMYDFQQDYSSFFKNKNIDENFVKKLTDIFNEMIDGEKLSIRELENAFNKNDIFVSKDEYKIFEIIHNKIWPATSKIKDFFSEDIDKFIFLQNQKLNFLKKNWEKIIERDSQNNYLNVSNSFKEKIKLVNWNDDSKPYFVFFRNYVKHFKIFHENILQTYKNRKNFEKKLSQKDSEILNEIESRKDSILKNITKIENYNKKMEQEKNKNDIDENKITKYEMNIKNLQEKTNSLKNQLKLDDVARDENYNQLIQIKEDIDRQIIFKKDFPLLIKELEELYHKEKELFSKSKLVFLKKMIIKSFDDEFVAGEQFENLSNSDFKEKLMLFLINEILNT